ncbi:peptidase M48, Ste24p [Novosphingobium aromaticivorans DSM 12444]|uniref:Peptidase M48, Ste24p n=2 Tax=Novosphingobium aromaticivorans TaxID=48935 RepID=Q2G3B9_NOVAD|nr:peptidase M48, Ste24p [Novosphingobium aromaticivorans DSM 12444]SCY31345.1 Peptidase family M48 [Novosphingobium aromaticivorans]
MPMKTKSGMGRRRWLVAASAAVLLASCATMAVGQEASWPIRLRQDMTRVIQVEWRLRSAAGSSCERQATDAGVLFDDRRAYGTRDWPLLQDVLGMDEAPVVAAVATGGPADTAGLRAGDEVLSIGGVPAEDIAAARKAGNLVAEALLAEIAERPAGVPLAVEVRRGGGAPLRLQLSPVRHCAARLVLVTDRGVDAYSDQSNVALTTGLVTFARTDDELALAAGHELAHIINGDRKGGGISARRRMEDLADERGLRLLQCAGYDRASALGLFERLGSRDWLGFLRAPTHRSFAKRVERLRQTAPSGICPVPR